MKHNQKYFGNERPSREQCNPPVIIIQDGICLKSDREIIWQSLMSKVRSLERQLEKKNLSPQRRLTLQDEYERTYALTGKYGRK